MPRVTDMDFLGVAMPPFGSGGFCPVPVAHELECAARHGVFPRLTAFQFLAEPRFGGMGGFAYW